MNSKVKTYCLISTKRKTTIFYAPYFNRDVLRHNETFKMLNERKRYQKVFFFIHFTLQKNTYRMHSKTWRHSQIVEVEE